MLRAHRGGSALVLTLLLGARRAGRGVACLAAERAESGRTAARAGNHGRLRSAARRGRSLCRPAARCRRARDTDAVRRHVPRFPPHDALSRQGARRGGRGGGITAEGVWVGGPMAAALLALLRSEVDTSE